MRKTIATREEDPTLDMSSLIDVSFLLLIYFLVTSTLDPRESDISMTLPGGYQQPGDPMEIDLMQIKVDASGQILLNDEVLESDSSIREVPLLLDRLATYAKSARLMDSEPVVIVAADDAAKGQRFVDVLNALSHADVAIKRVTLSGFED